MAQKDYCDFFARLAAHCDLKSLFHLLYRVSSVKLVSELNLWQAQNKSSNICSMNVVHYS